jgi:CubicO group peptidase (beta-lactamase class C family)
MTRPILTLIFAMTISSRAASSAAPDNRAVDALFAPYAQPKSPGASLLVLRDGKALITRNYGLTDVENKVPCAPETNFRLASVTKQFTATAILLLVAEHKLKLEEFLTSVFPEFPAYGKPITVRHLLNHTSGLPDYEELIPSGTSLPVLDRDVLRILMKQEKGLFPPGAKFQYSNSGYSLLALIVESRSGLTFANFLKTRIFEPLKMRNTLAYEQGLSIVPNRAYGYSADANSFKKTDQSLTSSVLGDGGIYSSVLDLARWDEALESSKLLGRHLQELAFTPGPETEHPNTRYGFGWYIGEYRGLKEIWHSGNSIGFTTRIARFPEKHFTVIVLANRSDAALAEIPHQIADLLLFSADSRPPSH